MKINFRNLLKPFFIKSKVVFVQVPCYPFIVKSAIFEVIIFLVSFVVCLLICSLSYFFYMYCVSYSVGNDISILFTEYIKIGIINTMPLSAIAASIMVYIYQAQTKIQFSFNLIVWVLVFITVWGFIIPTAFSCLNRNKEKYKLFPEKEILLSTQYFREYDNSIRYATKISSDNKVSGVYFDKNQTDFSKIQFFEEDISSQKSFHDPIIYDAISISKQNQRILDKTYSFFSNGIDENALTTAAVLFNKKYIAFASISLAIFSLWAMIWATSWRLLNMMLIICGALSIYFINIATFDVAALQNRLNSYQFINVTLQTEIPYSVIFNIIIFVLLTVLGSINVIKRSLKQRKNK